MRAEGHPATVSCDVLKLPKSSYYYRAVEVDEAEIEAAIEEIAGQFPTYGIRRVAQQLRRPPHEIKINRKRARRTMAEEKLLRPVKTARRTAGTLILATLIWSGNWKSRIPIKCGSAISPTYGSTMILSAWQSSWMCSPEPCEAHCQRMSQESTTAVKVFSMLKLP